MSFPSGGRHQLNETELAGVSNPYARCEKDQCNHDLVRGILVSDLLGGEGPYPRGGPLSALIIAATGGQGRAT